MDAITRLYASVYYLAFIVKRDVVLYSLKMIKDLVVSKKHCTVNHNVLYITSKFAIKSNPTNNWRNWKKAL